MQTLRFSVTHIIAPFIKTWTMRTKSTEQART